MQKKFCIVKSDVNDESNGCEQVEKADIERRFLSR